MKPRNGLDRRSAAVVVTAAVLAGGVGYAVADDLSSPSRLTDPVDTREALAPTASAGSPATPTRTASPWSSPSPAGPRARPATPSAPTTPAPSRLEIPSLGASLPVVPVGVDAGRAMIVPEDPGTAGWYRFGPGPTSPEGASVISAHTDTAGEVGPLSRLDEVQRGDRVTVTVDGEELRYEVRRVDHHSKEALDVDALFSRDGPARLHIVTCGGDFDPRTRSYEDNVVAVATPLGPGTPAYSDSRDG